MQIVSYHDSLFLDWDSFIKISKNGTVFHTRNFLSYHEEGRWEDASVLFYKKDVLIGVFPACKIGNRIVSHQGSTSGGLVVATTNTIEDSLEMFRLLNTHFEGNSIQFRKHEYIFDKSPAEEVEFAAQQMGYTPIHTELSTCVNLKTDTLLSKNTISKIKRGKQKLDIVFDDIAMEEYYSILSNNLKKHDATPTHSLEEMIKLKHLFPTEYILVTAKVEGKTIAGVWLLKPTPNTLHTFYIAIDYEYKSVYPLYSVFNELITYGKDNQFDFLNFGISTEDGGKVINKGLFNFKESFNGNGVVRTSYIRK